MKKELYNEKARENENNYEHNKKANEDSFISEYATNKEKDKFKESETSKVIWRVDMLHVNYDNDFNMSIIYWCYAINSTIRSRYFTQAKLTAAVNV